MAAPNTVSLPGGGKTVFQLPVATDASAALTTAIKSEFTAAGKNFTMNIVDSGKAGKAGFFNAVVSDGTKAGPIKAGTGVQAIFDQAAFKDTLTGGKSTTLIYVDATSKAGASISVVGTTDKSATTVFGGNGADSLTVTTGNATAYLEGTGNKVTLAGTTDTLSLAGSGAATVTASASKATTIFGGSGKVSIAGGVGTLKFTNEGGDDTVNVKNKTGDTLTGGLTSKGTDLFNITGTSGKYVINSFGSKDTIGGFTAAQAKAALASATVKGTGSNIVTTLTVGKDTITVTGVAVTKTNFT